MLTPTGVKLLDFGLAKLKPATTEVLASRSVLTTVAPEETSGALVGTVPYMAPEQLEGQALDARTDVFALGLRALRDADGAAGIRGGERGERDHGDPDERAGAGVGPAAGDAAARGPAGADVPGEGPGQAVGQRARCGGAVAGDLGHEWADARHGDQDRYRAGTVVDTPARGPRGRGAASRRGGGRRVCAPPTASQSARARRWGDTERPRPPLRCLWRAGGRVSHRRRAADDVDAARAGRWARYEGAAQQSGGGEDQGRSHQAGRAVRRLVVHRHVDYGFTDALHPQRSTRGRRDEERAVGTPVRGVAGQLQRSSPPGGRRDPPGGHAKHVTGSDRRCIVRGRAGVPGGHVLSTPLRSLPSTARLRGRAGGLYARSRA